jgi:hypothetical protein
MLFIFSDEAQPQPCDNSSIINLPSRFFLAGSLAFFATVLGKENMIAKWYNWCNFLQRSCHYRVTITVSYGF